MLKIFYILIVMSMDQKSEGDRYVKLDLLCMSENSFLNSSLGVPKIYSLSWGNKECADEGDADPFEKLIDACHLKDVVIAGVDLECLLTIRMRDTRKPETNQREGQHNQQSRHQDWRENKVFFPERNSGHED